MSCWTSISFFGLMLSIFKVLKNEGVDHAPPNKWGEMSTPSTTPPHMVFLVPY